MQRAEMELRERGIPYAVLHASVAGRPLYEKLGWASTNEMSKALG
jgi:predicted acetyltransferase